MQLSPLIDDYSLQKAIIQQQLKAVQTLQANINVCEGSLRMLSPGPASACKAANCGRTLRLGFESEAISSDVMKSALLFMVAGCDASTRSCAAHTQTSANIMRMSLSKSGRVYVEAGHAVQKKTVSGMLRVSKHGDGS